MTPESPAPPAQDLGAPRENACFWNYIDLFTFFGISVLCLLVSSGVVTGIGWLLHVPKESRLLLAVPTQVLGYGLIFTALRFLLRIQYGRPLLASLGWVPSRIPVLEAVAAGLITAVAIVLLASLLHLDQKDTTMQRLVSTPLGFTLVAIAATTFGPLAEELIFRGFIQPLLVRGAGVVGGVAITSIGFGSLHLSEYGNSWKSGVLVALAGAAFGLIRLRAGSTRASTWAHMTYNASFFVTLILAGKYQ